MASAAQSPRDWNLAQRKARFTVGIDFGNSFSGYAFAANSDENVVTVNWKWDGQEQSGFTPYCKTRTAVVVRPGAADVHKWGWPAVLDTTAKLSAASPGEDELVSSFSRLGSAPAAAAADSAPAPSTPPRPSSSSSDRELLINFKMLLAPRGSGGGGPGAASSSSQPPSSTAAAPAQLPSGWTPRALIARFLRRLGSEAMAALRAKHPLARDDDVQFCITVPAIWDEDAKQTMRLAAEDAGLGGGGAGLPLLMVLEPEAAAVYVHKTLSRSELNLKPGDVTMLVDCGGGTVDIVSHIREDHGGPFPRLREVVKGSGGCCGASALDAQFLLAAARRIPVFDEFRRRHPAEAAALLLGPWERVKRGYGGDGPVTVRLPPALVRMWRRHRAEFPALAGAEDDEDEELTLSEAEMHDIFHPVLESIAELIEGQLDASAAAGTCRAIVVVGGFAQQPFLQRVLTVEFQEDEGVPVVFPENSGVAVVEGAVMYGLHPYAIHVRCARKTYGVSYAKKISARSGWLRRCDEESSRFKKFFNDENDRWYVDGLFDRFVTCGEVVEIDRTVLRTRWPIFRNQKGVIFGIFSTSDPKPETVLDEGCVAEGFLTRS